MPRSKDITHYTATERALVSDEYIAILPQKIRFTTLREARATVLQIHAILAAVRNNGTGAEKLNSYKIMCRAPVQEAPECWTITLENKHLASSYNPLLQNISANLGNTIPDIPMGAESAPGADGQEVQPPVLADCGAFGTFTSMPPSILGGYAVSALPASPAPNASTGVQPPGANASADEGGQGVGDQGVNSPTGEPA